MSFWKDGGGHLIRDNWNIKIMNTIGQDNGVIIQYKKNLKEITAKYDWSNVVTKLLHAGYNGILLDTFERHNCGIRLR